MFVGHFFAPLHEGKQRELESSIMQAKSTLAGPRNCFLVRMSRQNANEFGHTLVFVCVTGSANRCSHLHEFDPSKMTSCKALQGLSLSQGFPQFPFVQGKTPTQKCRSDRNKQTHRQIDGQTNSQTSKQASNQASKQASNQSNKQTIT